MDGATGLTYMQQRYYDPLLGRFLSVDPVTADANTGFNFNRYWYANNNPYKFTDPDGRLPFLVPVAAGAARCAASAPCRIAVTTGSKKAAKWVGAAIAGALGAREGMRQANESAEPTESAKEPIPGAVDLVDDLAGQEVAGQIEAGEGKVLSGMGDKKFDSETGTHDKVAKSRDNADGTKTEVHADRNRKTGEVENVKIKQQGPTCRQASGC